MKKYFRCLTLITFIMVSCIGCVNQNYSEFLYNGLNTANHNNYNNEYYEGQIPHCGLDYYDGDLFLKENANSENIKIIKSNKIESEIDVNCIKFQVFNECVYFIDAKEEYLIKLNLENNEKTEMFKAYKFLIYNNKIYYSAPYGDKQSLYSCDLNGENIDQIILSNEIQWFTIKNGNLQVIYRDVNSQYAKYNLEKAILEINFDIGYTFPHVKGFALNNTTILYSLDSFFNVNEADSTICKIASIDNIKCFACNDKSVFYSVQKTEIDGSITRNVDDELNGTWELSSDGEGQTKISDKVFTMMYCYDNDYLTCLKENEFASWFAYTPYHTNIYQIDLTDNNTLKCVY